MCNLFLFMPCFNSFDFLNWYFQPIGREHLEIIEKKQRKIVQKSQKTSKNTPALIPNLNTCQRLWIILIHCDAYN